MSMPSHIELIQAANVIGEWFFWFIIYVIITLVIGVLAFTAVYLIESKHEPIKINRSARGLNYGKSRRINKRVA